MPTTLSDELKTSLPHALPHTVEQLIEELDTLIPVVTIRDPSDIIQPRQLLYDCGRRSVVEYLLRLLKED